MSLEGIIVGLLAAAIGAAFAFYGLKLFVILLPIWGFLVGLMAGASWGAEFLGEGFLGTVTSWGIGIVLGLVLAVLSYFWYYGAVILLGASVGYTLGAGLMAAIGLDGFLSVVVGLIVAAVVGFGVLVLAVPAFLVVFLSAIGGAAAVVNGVLILLGRVALEDVDFGLTQGLYKEGVIAIVAWIVIAVVAMWWQLREVADMSARLSVPREEYRIA
ncbi:MAG TPA: DUF4203 domain-containing protein [Candidatus Limnocylindrales bacterium]